MVGARRVAVASADESAQAMIFYRGNDVGLGDDGLTWVGLGSLIVMFHVRGSYGRVLPSTFFV